jgi:hypothetical protein
LIVNECDLNGWIKHAQAGATGTIGFVNGPGTTPSGKGSVKLTSSDNKIVRLKNNDYDGTPLSSIRELSFATYIEQRGNQRDNLNIILTIDADNNGTVDFPLVFNTEFQTGNFANGFPDQGPSVNNTWQTWDLLHAGWWKGLPAPDPYHGGALNSIAGYVSLYPNAVIRNPAEPGPGGIRINCGSPVFEGAFIGYADKFIISTDELKTTYDFEGDRLLICHNGAPICISSNALGAHLAHGDYIGNCTQLVYNKIFETETFTKDNITISVYPNPATGVNILKYNLLENSNVSIGVYDIMGRLVTSVLHQPQSKGLQSINYNTNNILDGTYYLKLTAVTPTNSTSKSIKLVVLH